MTMTISIRELSRNASSLNQYDYVEIEDKKTHEFKGIFVSSKYAQDVKELIDKKLKEEKSKKLDKIMKFAGIATGDTDNMSSKEIQELKNKKYD
jgi:3'-phosphoadenosine 5'-phosphosulfate (PAPS) 3'-phosphatase